MKKLFEKQVAERPKPTDDLKVLTVDKDKLAGRVQQLQDLTKEKESRVRAQNSIVAPTT
jgi:hypothetical protein